MDRLYNLKALTEALKPEPPVVRLYKGRKVHDEPEPVFHFRSFKKMEIDNPIPEPVKEHVVQVPVEQEPVVQEPEPEIKVSEPITPPRNPNHVYEAPRKPSNTPSLSQNAIELFLESSDIETKELRVDTTKFANYMVVYGLNELSEEQKSCIRAVGGKWKPKFGGWVFGKAKMINYASERKKSVEVDVVNSSTPAPTPRHDSDEIDDPENDESD